MDYVVHGFMMQTDVLTHFNVVSMATMAMEEDCMKAIKKRIWKLKGGASTIGILYLCFSFPSGRVTNTFSTFH
ncbi:hypothetical protein Scep_020091 [Stephania cephalantha]|uniref:Uncharacterized protein n=1 Tax=Stephania cephalantha TaxID=152367 RepID=A0AAP0IC90_9MAGN